ncbi:glycoside hydrolase family 71/99-like protein [Cytophaga sp. FL35]|uniref:glycoside hydrolase family 71/99-like protein n=1 Tax=Cytophaga sp. FL35 TaxID=1904456 RepID=UPI001653DEE7|nr:glycoside hydrolase family 71/99-like protein [Cytophaga sp. FL35]MBC7000738.1 glycoside hydrolase family 99-like domain-containing protein [Cytophaga sp. FL35]
METSTVRPSDSILRKVLSDEDNFIGPEHTGKQEVGEEMKVMKSNPKKIYAHYMPWFQSKDYDSFWGKHWTMANRDPDNIDSNGKREIASFYYPEIGPYSSMDPDLQEYHFLLMKLSGIDGVIFDWYGSRDMFDYGTMKSSTETFMWRLEDLGLDFSIMYEDRTAFQAVEMGMATDVIAAAQEDFLYVKHTYLDSPRYMHWDGKPLIFVFGPHYIQQPSQWDQIFTVFENGEKPNYISLWSTSDRWVGNSASGEFAWIDKTHLDAHGHYYWHMDQTQKLTVGSIYPGFESFYGSGGWGTAHDWSIYPNNGLIFFETLDYTHQQTSDFIQIATWNDFGEGTVIEPTKEFGFTYLEMLQDYTGVPYDTSDLQLALDLYHLRKELALTTNTFKVQNNGKSRSPQRYLDRAYFYIKKGRLTRARLLLWAVERFY